MAHARAAIPALLFLIILIADGGETRGTTEAPPVADTIAAIAIEATHPAKRDDVDNDPYAAAAAADHDTHDDGNAATTATDADAARSTFLSTGPTASRATSEQKARWKRLKLVDWNKDDVAEWILARAALAPGGPARPCRPRRCATRSSGRPSACANSAWTARRCGSSTIQSQNNSLCGIYILDEK